jgi:hypothetical protein
MSRCQACDKQATHHSKHGALRARCCSERCGRELFAGLSVVNDGAIHVAAASPLGRAIAQRTQHRCDHILPASVAAQLVGALQRIGPKRAAADADLPASAQADVPTPIDWIADIPRDVWATAILPYLQRNDLRAFAATSSGSAAAARDERVQAAKYRETHTAYHAALLYMGTEISNERRRVVRMAYPDAAEMALALLLTFAIEPVYAKNWTNAQYFARVRALRTECGRDGDALYERPILLPSNTIRFSNGMLVPAESATPVLARAIRYYTKRVATISPMLNTRRDTLMRTTKPGAKFPLETPSSPSFFGTIRLTMIDPMDYTVSVPVMTNLMRRGVDLTRYDAALWFYFFSQFTIPAGTNIFANTPALRFDRPRTQPGQFSILAMGMASFHPEHEDISELLYLRDLLEHEIVQPVKFGDPAGLNILFYPTIFNATAWAVIVDRCYRLSYSMLYDPAPNGQRPFEHYIESFTPNDVMELMEAAPSSSRGFMAWGPFDPALDDGKPRLLAKSLQYQYELVDAILNTDNSPIESIDESYELVEYTRHVAAIAQEAIDAGNQKRAIHAGLILQRIAETLPDETTHAAEYNEIRYDGMDPHLRSRFAALDPPGMS